MSLLRAKFELMAINRRKGYVPMVSFSGEPMKNCNGEHDLQLGLATTLELLAVDNNRDSEHENTRSWLACPKGKMEIEVTDPALIAQLRVGEEYYLELSVCDTAVAPRQERVLI